MPFSIAQIKDDAARVFAKHKRCVIAISEGVSDETGRPIAERLMAAGAKEVDAHGNLQLSGGDLGLALQSRLKEWFPGKRARVDTFGYLPRGFIGCISRRDQAEAFAAGAFAAATLAEGSTSVALQMQGTECRPVRVPLAAVAGKTRHMPPEFLDAARAGLSPEGRAYFGRLLCERPETREIL